jgi:hypothetical protein
MRFLFINLLQPILQFLKNCKMGGNKLMNKTRILYGGNRSDGQKAGQNQNTVERIANGNYW